MSTNRTYVLWGIPLALCIWLLVADDKLNPIMYALLFAYFIPGLISSVRMHPSRNSIWVINAFLGWTFVGWVASLAWAVGDKR